MRKWFSRYRAIAILGCAVLGLLLVLGIAWWRLDGAIAYNLRTTINTTLGIPVRIERLHYRLFQGRLEIGDLMLNNPEGFSTPYFLNAKGFEVRFKPLSFLGSEAKIEQFAIAQVDVNLEQQLTRNNALIILENAKRQRNINIQANLLDRGKKFQLERATVNLLTAHLNFALGARNPALSVEIPAMEAIEFENLTPENFESIVMSDLVDRLVSSIIKTVILQSRQVAPQNLLELLEKIPLPQS